MERLCKRVREGPDIDAVAAVAAFAGDINTRNKHGYTVLLAAVMFNRPQTIDALVARGDCNPNFRSLVLQSPLYFAAREPSGVLLTLLLSAFPTLDMDVRDDRGWFPLHFAAALGYESHVQLLLDAGANPTQKKQHHMDPHRHSLRAEVITARLRTHWLRRKCGSLVRRGSQDVLQRLVNK